MTAPSSENGTERVPRFGLSGKLGPFKLGGKIVLKAEHKVTYTVEKGIVLNGASYVLESYARDQYVPTHDLGLWDAVTTTWTALVESFAPAHFSDVNGVISNQGTTRLRSTFTATMDIDGTKEPAPFEAGLFSWRFRPIDDTTCDVEFDIAYEFKSRTLGLLMGAMFDTAFRRFAAAFEARADQVYGVGVA